MHESQDIEYSCNVVMYRIHKHVMGHFYYSKFVRFQRQTEWFILFYGLFFLRNERKAIICKYTFSS